MVFIKGQIPWNKGNYKAMSLENSPAWKGGLPNCKDCGKKLSQRHSKTSLCKVCFFTSDEFLIQASQRLKKINNKGKKNHLWKGAKVSYRALHKWVQRWLGIAMECVYCGKEKMESNIEWASISHHAKRDLSDYIPLCVTCHREYDRKGRI